MMSTASLGEARCWFPCLDFVGGVESRPTWDIAIVTGPQRVATCSGALEEQVQLSDGRKAAYFSLEVPTPASQIAFAVGYVLCTGLAAAMRMLTNMLSRSAATLRWCPTRRCPPTRIFASGA